MAGPILIERGDTPGYERFRQAAIRRFKGTTDPIFAERTLKISLLLPANDQLMKDLEPYSELASDSIQGQRKPNDIMAAWRCISVSLMAYRQGYTPTAVAWSKRCLAYPDLNPPRMATAHIIQAMALWQLKEADSARTQLALGTGLVAAEFAGEMTEGNGSAGFWYDWLFARILLREADALIGKTPAAAAAGK